MAEGEGNCFLASVALETSAAAPATTDDALDVPLN